MLCISRVFSGASGELKHGIYGGNGYTTVEYSGEIVSKVYRYLPPADGPDGGIRDVITYTWERRVPEGRDSVVFGMMEALLSFMRRQVGAKD